MKRRLKNYGDESYWKSFTDIMAGLLLIILLVLMLLLLLMTQMEKKQNDYDKEFDDVGISNNDNTGKNDNTSTHRDDHEKENDYSSSGGGGKGSGVDDPGTKTNDAIYMDVGHDKTAVFVTVVDEETKNVIKKEGIRFELYASRNARGGLQILHTYYPEKIEYKKYETTVEGTFFLPEKITRGWYSLHNLIAPEGYGLAKDVNFEINESRDWSEPFLVTVPMAPEKGIIYVQNVDAATKEKIPGGTYEVYAAEDIVTLDETVRYKSGEKVDTFKCDSNGKGQSKELYLGKYQVVQATPLKYYALNKSPLNVEIKDEEDHTVHTIRCDKTTVEVKMIDEYSEASIGDAVISVTGKKSQRTDEMGTVRITDLDKKQEYTIKIENVPAPYRLKTDTLTFKVDADGYISGEPTAKFVQTAYMTRLSTEVKDILFGISASGRKVCLYNRSGDIVEEWESGSASHVIEGLDPGEYTMEVDNMLKLTQEITLRDSAALQKAEQAVWTWLDTGAVVLAVVMLGFIVILIVHFARRVRKRKANGKQENEEE